MTESNRCLTCGDEIPNGCLYCIPCIEESEIEEEQEREQLMYEDMYEEMRIQNYDFDYGDVKY